jgi:hypothetical protein
VAGKLVLGAPGLDTKSPSLGQVSDNMGIPTNFPRRLLRLQASRRRTIGLEPPKGPTDNAGSGSCVWSVQRAIIVRKEGAEKQLPLA